MKPLLVLSLLALACQPVPTYTSPPSETIVITAENGTWEFAITHRGCDFFAAILTNKSAVPMGGAWKMILRNQGRNATTGQVSFYCDTAFPNGGTATCRPLISTNYGCLDADSVVVEGPPMGMH